MVRSDRLWCNWVLKLQLMQRQGPCWRKVLEKAKGTVRRWWHNKSSCLQCTCKPRAREWILDSGDSAHMIGSKEFVSDYNCDSCKWRQLGSYRAGNSWFQWWLLQSYTYWTETRLLFQESPGQDSNGRQECYLSKWWNSHDNDKMWSVLYPWILVRRIRIQRSFTRNIWLENCN